MHHELVPHWYNASKHTTRWNEYTIITEYDIEEDNVKADISVKPPRAKKAIRLCMGPYDTNETNVKIHILYHMATGFFPEPIQDYTQYVSGSEIVDMLYKIVEQNKIDGTLGLKLMIRDGRIGK